MNYYQNYRTAHLALKIRAIYINNMLSEMEVSDKISPYKPNWIGVYTDDLEMDTSLNSITLTYYPQWETFTDEWTVPIEWLGMSDEGIKQTFLQWATEQLQAEADRKEKQLKDLAEYLGYGLTRIESREGLV